MMRVSTLLLAAGALVLLALVARADVVHTKDGRRLEGTIVKETRTEIVIETRIGEITVARSEIREIVRGKTPRQEFRERLEAAETAAEFSALGTWASERDLDSEARRAWRKALELDPEDEVANLGIGNVRYDGEWMTPEERDERIREKEEAAMRARGLVRYEGRWVTPEDRARLEEGLVQVDGEWVTVAEAKRRQGLAELDGAWVPIPVARATHHAREVLAAGGAPGRVVVGSNVAVAGVWDEAFLGEIRDGLERGRGLFDAQFRGVPPGLQLLGGRPSEFYVFGRDSRPYRETIDELGALSPTVGDAWEAAVAKTHGYVYWDPFGVSSVRAVGRPEFHLAGHSYYHWGHILLNRHRYDGRLLPPWLGEGYGSLMEWWIHGRNTVVLKATSRRADGRTVAAGKGAPFGREELTRGDWKLELARALRERDPRLENIDLLVRKGTGELTVVDIAMSMGVVLWLVEGQPEERAGALDRLHASLKASAPPAPAQILNVTAERIERYDTAFEAAVGMDRRAADRAWRAWFLETH